MSRRSEALLRRELIRVAHANPDTRVHLLPIIRKHADLDDVFSNDELMGFEDDLMAREWGKAIHRKILDNEKGIIGPPTGTRGNPSGAYGKYKSHPNSPDAGADGSPQRKKYNEWYRKTICPDKGGCGAPWLAK